MSMLAFSRKLVVVAVLSILGILIAVGFYLYQQNRANQAKTTEEKQVQNADAKATPSLAQQQQIRQCQTEAQQGLRCD